MTAPQDTETYIQNEVIHFACKLRIRFAALFEKYLCLKLVNELMMMKQ